MSELDILKIVIDNINWLSEAVQLDESTDFEKFCPYDECHDNYVISKYISDILIGKFLRIEIYKKFELYSGGSIIFEFAVRIPIQTIEKDCYNNMKNYLIQHITDNYISKISHGHNVMYDLEHIFSNNDDTIINIYEYSIEQDGTPFIEVIADGK